MSSRELVIDYLARRTQDAWNEGDDEQAGSCNRFLTVVEGMSDAQFDRVYDEDAPEVVGT